MPIHVNGDCIDDEALEREMQNLKSSYEMQTGEMCCCSRDDEFRGHARDNLIARALIAQQAQSEVEPASEAELEQAWQALLEQHGGEDKLHEALSTTPEQVPQLRSDLAQTLRVQKLLDRWTQPAAEPSDQQLREFYQSHLDRYLEPQKLRASHIIKRVGHGEDRLAVHAQMCQWREQLLSGADFAALAREHSDRPEDAGDLGYFTRSEILEEFSSVAFSMQVGEISPVFLSPFGYHIVCVTERVPAAPKPFEQVRSQVLEDYHQHVREQKVQARLAELRDAAVIHALEVTG